MCGHVGIAGKLAYKDEKTMKRLLIFDLLRGPDSTGMAAIRSFNDDVKIAKIASNPINLFDTQRYKEASNGAQSHVFLGHNRAATKGAVNDINAHPFHHGNIVGAHNGTLTNRNFKELTELCGEVYGTDSETLFAVMGSIGVEETIPLLEKGRDKSDGAWSLVFYDTDKKTLNFIRNEWRPMWYAFNKELDRIFWASEYWMIEAAVASSDNDYELYADADGFQYFETDTDVLYSFDIPELKKGGKLPEPVLTPLKGKEPVTAGSNFPFQGRATTSGNTGTTNRTNSTTTSHGRTSKSVELLHLEGTELSPYANVLSKDEFEDMAAGGCAWCHHKVPYGTQGVTVFERDGIVICPDCCGASDPAYRRGTRIYVPKRQIDALL